MPTPPHRRALVVVPLLLGLFGCQDRGEKSGETGLPPGSDPGGDGGEDDGGDGGVTEPDTVLEGFIGSPCTGDADCDYDGGFCLLDDDGFPEGTCSAPCDQYCDDQEGHPTTFCVPADQLPAAAQSKIDAGACVSRCDLGQYPVGDGCREDYGCAVVSRMNDEARETWACVPGAEMALPECYLELRDRGVGFEPDRWPDSSPEDSPSLRCVVEDSLWIAPELAGLPLILDWETEPTRQLMACEAAHSLLDTAQDVAAAGAVTLRHMGTYNCRTIAGTSTLSRHAFGDAIDLSGFDMVDGRRFSVLDHWEHDTTDFETEEGAWLYGASHRWFGAGFWNIVLTPNYNVAHDNHFHVDLTPGSDYIGFTDGRYFGPAPYAD